MILRCTAPHARYPGRHCARMIAAGPDGTRILRRASSPEDRTDARNLVVQCKCGALWEITPPDALAWERSAA